MRRIESALGVMLPAAGTDSNVAPSAVMPVVRAAGSGFEVAMMKWGLVPNWSREPRPGFSTFNARVETASEKPAFRDSWLGRRCLVPASGFYEWREEGGKKAPWLIAPSDGEGFAFAGLWDRWGAGEKAFDSYTILVGRPNELVAPIHDRMPVMLDESVYRKWLDPATDPADLPGLLPVYPAGRLKAGPRDPRPGMPTLF